MIELTVLLSVVSVCASVAFAFISWKRAGDKSVREDARQTAEISVKLDNIGKSVEEIRIEQKGITQTVKDLSERVIIVEQSTKSAHKRLDAIENKVAREE